MPLHAWSRRTIGRLWLVGLLLEAGLVGVGVAQTRRERARADAEFARLFGPSGRRAAPPSADAVRRLESAGVKLEMHGDTITRVTLSPEAEREVRPIIEAVGQMGRTMAPALMWVVVSAAAIYLAVPAALIALTLAWGIAQRRMRSAGRAA